MSHFALLLFAGDYWEAGRRVSQGLADQYRHHGYALGTLAALRRQGHEVSVVQVRSERPYDRRGDDGTRFLGLGTDGAAEKAATVGRFLAAERATHAMVRFPATEMITAVLDSGARTSVVLADSFSSPRRHRERYDGLGTVLRDPRVDFVANHHLASSEQLVERFALRPSAVVPWDWPLDLTSLAASSARRHPGGTTVRLGYVGTISRIKGVWDLLVAVRLLRARGVDARLDVAGRGGVDPMWRVVDRLRLRDHVDFHGRVGGDDVLDLMRRATFMSVPSRHSYPEGLPLTLYETSASGTPVVASDHPMFRYAVLDGETAFVHRAGRPDRLAAAVLRGWRNPTAYERVSAAAAAAYPRLGHPTLWGDLVLRWVRGDDEDLAWLRTRSLAGLGPGTDPATPGRGRC